MIMNLSGLRMPFLKPLLEIEFLELFDFIKIELLMYVIINSTAIILFRSLDIVAEESLIQMTIMNARLDLLAR